MSYYHPPYYQTPPQTSVQYPFYLDSGPTVECDDVRTLFVAGLPEDVKNRELYNLFRDFPGYQSSHLRTPNQTSQPFAFAVFSDQQSALSAMRALNGMLFDLEKGSTLYLDLAKSNSRSKRPRTREHDQSGLDKKFRGSCGFRRNFPDYGFGSVHMPGMVNYAHNTIGSTQSFDGLAVGNSSTFKLNAMPCPTVFVANLGPNCTEQELIQLFSRCPGFLKLKMQSTYGSPVAFVDFKDTACSSGALSHLQGTILYSSIEGEGIRLEFAKSRMGMRKKTSK